MDNLHVTPRPEHVTELYFTDYRKPPASLKSGAIQKVAFTVHNLEHKSTQYHYVLLTKASDGAEQLWGEGTFNLDHDQSRATTRQVTTPSRAGRTAIEVDLDYVGTAFGSGAATIQKQSIHYWVDVESARSRM